MLLQLFRASRRFNVEVQPQLTLLQKTLLNVEGLGRQLDPDLDLWVTAKPFLERWMEDQIGLPRAARAASLAEAPYLVAALPELPRLLHQKAAARRRRRPTARCWSSSQAQRARNRWLAIVAVLLVLRAAGAAAAAASARSGRTVFSTRYDLAARVRPGAAPRPSAGAARGAGTRSARRSSARTRSSSAASSSLSAWNSSDDRLEAVDVAQRDLDDLAAVVGLEAHRSRSTCGLDRGTGRSAACASRRARSGTGSGSGRSQPLLDRVDLAAGTLSVDRLLAVQR